MAQGSMHCLINELEKGQILKDLEFFYQKGLNDESFEEKIFFTNSDELLYQVSFSKACKNAFDLGKSKQPREKLSEILSNYFVTSIF
jgi:hypothetical protein